MEGMAERKAPVTRFLEFLRFPTVSGDGPSGAYQQVRACIAFVKRKK